MKKNLTLDSTKKRLSHISSFIEKIPLKNKFLAALLSLGLPFYVLFSFHLYLKIHLFKVPHIDIVFVYIALSWVWLGPYLIWRYEKWELFAVKKALAKVIEKDKGISLFNKYELPLDDDCSSVTIVIIWTSLVLIAFYGCKPYVLNLGFSGPQDNYYFLSYIFVAFLASLTGLGFVATFRTFLIVYSIYKHKNINLKLNCYHPDEINGFSALTKFTKTTTFCFASGSLFIPIFIKIFSALSFSRPFIVVLIGLFSAVILFSYAGPNYLIYLKAKSRKDKILQTIYKKYLMGYYEEMSYRSYDDYCFYRSLFNDIKKTSISPFRAKELSPVFISVIMPIIAALIPVIISNYFPVSK